MCSSKGCDSCQWRNVPELLRRVALRSALSFQAQCGPLKLTVRLIGYFPSSCFPSRIVFVSTTAWLHIFVRMMGVRLRQPLTSPSPCIIPSFPLILLLLVLVTPCFVLGATRDFSLNTQKVTINPTPKLFSPHLLTTSYSSSTGRSSYRPRDVL